MNYYWRLFATGFCFLIFGIGGVILRFFVFPIMSCFPGGVIQKQRRARLCIHFSFFLFLELMRRTGVLTYDFDGLENLLIGVGDPFGKPLSFALLGNNNKDLEEASILFVKKLKEIKGVAAASTNYEYGPDEINFTLKEKAKSLGLTNYQILYQVRQGFFGTQVQDLQKNKDEMKLWIRYDEDEKNSFSSLESMKIKTEKGIFPLNELVHFDIDNKIVSINRKNGSKIIEVEGELASNTSYSSDIISEVENTMFPFIQKNLLLREGWIFTRISPPSTGA